MKFSHNFYALLFSDHTQDDLKKVYDLLMLHYDNEGEE